MMMMMICLETRETIFFILSYSPVQCSQITTDHANAIKSLTVYPYTSSTATVD